MGAITPVRVKHLTPVLVVDRVEPCIEFWVERLGFQTANQIPGPDGTLAFASVRSNDVEIMYQTRASALTDWTGEMGELAGHSTALFITVDDLDRIEQAVAGAPLVRARHKTFYGSTELYVREPGGNLVGFAQMGS